MLFGAVRELWIVFALVILTNLAYRLVNFTLSLWLTSDLGFSDEQTGLAVMIWSAGLTLAVVLVGSLTDALGLRKTFLLGFALCIISRVFLTFTTVKWVALGGGMALLALGEGMGTPVTIAALRRYTTTAQRSIAYSVFYAIMNAGFFIALYISDALRAGMGEHGRFAVPGLGMELSTYRTIFLASLALAVPSFLIAYFWVREGVEATDQGVVITPVQPKYPGVNMFQALGSTVRDTLRDTGRIFVGLWQQPGFYKFLAFLSFAAFVKMIFLHMDYTYPKFGIRELGEGSPIGHLYALNAILIVFLAPLVGVLTQKLPAYRMVIFGSFVAASSVFIMTVPAQRFQRLADGRVGHAIANSWLGGYSRFSPDDFHNLPAFANQLQSGSNSVSLSLEGIPVADHPRAAQPAARERFPRRKPLSPPHHRPGLRRGTQRRARLPEATAGRPEPGHPPGLAIPLGRVLLQGQGCPRGVRSGCRGPSSGDSGPRAEPRSSGRTPL